MSTKGLCNLHACMRNEHKCKLNTPFARAPLTPKLFSPSLIPSLSLSLLFTNHAVSFFLSSSNSCHFHLCLHETSMHFLFSITLYYIYKIKYKHPSNPLSLSYSLSLSLHGRDIGGPPEGLRKARNGRRRCGGAASYGAGAVWGVQVLEEEVHERVHLCSAFRDGPGRGPVCGRAQGVRGK